MITRIGHLRTTDGKQPGDQRACYLCGKVVQWWGSKRYVRHKCPHGKWCPSGRAGGAQGINTPVHCKPCCDDQRKREGRS